MAVLINLLLRHHSSSSPCQPPSPTPAAAAAAAVEPPTPPSSSPDGGHNNGDNNARNNSVPAGAQEQPSESAQAVEDDDGGGSGSGNGVERVSWCYAPRQADKAECGYVGLQNLGATCYMNSLLQQLYMVPALRYGVLSCDPFFRSREQEEKGEEVVAREENLLYQLQVKSCPVGRMCRAPGDVCMLRPFYAWAELRKFVVPAGVEFYFVPSCAVEGTMSPRLSSPRVPSPPPAVHHTPSGETLLQQGAHAGLPTVCSRKIRCLMGAIMSGCGNTRHPLSSHRAAKLAGRVDLYQPQPWLTFVFG